MKTTPKAVEARPGLRVARVEELQATRTAKFAYRDQDGIPREGFAALVGEQVVVYQNVCRHLPVSIDYGDNEFFSADGAMIVCRTHGAEYEPLGGLCVRGPCEGARLLAIPFEVRGGEIWIEGEAA